MRLTTLAGFTLAACAVQTAPADTTDDFAARFCDDYDACTNPLELRPVTPSDCRAAITPDVAAAIADHAEGCETDAGTQDAATSDPCGWLRCTLADAPNR